MTEPVVKRGTPYIPPRRSENQHGYPPAKDGLQVVTSRLGRRSRRGKKAPNARFACFGWASEVEIGLEMKTPGALVGLSALRAVK